jgi:predicted transglutaminase-like cysteine proteinase
MARKFILARRKILMAAAALAPASQSAQAAPLSIQAGPAEEARPSGILKHAAARKRKRRARKRGRSTTRRKVTTAAATRAGISRKNATGNALLFGTHETESSNFKPFKKWSGAMQRMSKEQANLGKFKKRFKKWIVFLDGLKGKSRLTQSKAVNKFMNRSKYIQDNKNWGIKDYWASPGEFLSKFGDCEDYSIAKYMALKYLGMDAGKMRIVAVRDLNLKIGHAILAVYHKDRIMILDNQIKIVADSRKIRHCQPVYSINEKHWWRHRV